MKRRLTVFGEWVLVSCAIVGLMCGDDLLRHHRVDFEGIAFAFGVMSIVFLLVAGFVVLLDWAGLVDLGLTLPPKQKPPRS